ncbi:MAG: helix-turn-helix transcriptional regulator [Acidobacteriota bacterium]
MNGFQLAQSRLSKGLEQQEAAEILGVSQSYLSLLESGKRKLNQKLAEKVVKVFNLPPEKLPLMENWEDLPKADNNELAESLATLGYPKFSHLKKGKLQNPAEVLFSAFQNENLDSRIVEGLPWLVFTFPELDWDKLTKYAKMFDFQNRLGFVVNLTRQLAEKVGDKTKQKSLLAVEKKLEKSRLLREDSLSKVTETEKAYLKTNRPKEAKFWRVLSDLSVSYLDYV